VTWCENGLPTSPYTSAPAGAVTVPAGNNSSQFQYQMAANTTYWFAAGKHTNASVQTADGDTFLGAPGAILDGGNTNNYAFVGQYNDTADQSVTIKYLTIENYDPMQGGGAVNGNGNNGWTEEYDLMQDNSPGAAMMLGGDNTVSNNCMTANGEYGFNGYSYVDQTYEDTFTGGATNITFTNNDVSGNNTQKTSSGIEGGGKFWQNGNVTVTGNYFHGNIDSPGVWMDTDNAGFLVQGNYFSDNGGEGLMYEISYNADILNNTFVQNGMEAGPGNPGFPTGAIYISESGGNSSVPSNYAGELNIQNNVFNDNWSGVVLYQNSNRYVGDGQDPGTLTPPSGVDMQTWINTDGPNNCPSHLTETSPIDYHSICQWRTQNVTVQDNQFTFNPSDSVYGGKCTAANGCGENGLFSPYSSTSAYPEYTVCNLISNGQGNVFSDNTYTGPWSFMYFNQGDTATWSQWTSGLTNVESSGDNFGAQDSGSTYSQ
jgi:Right handed beta helix region